MLQLYSCYYLFVITFEMSLNQLLASYLSLSLLQQKLSQLQEAFPGICREVRAVAGSWAVDIPATNKQGAIQPSCHHTRTSQRARRYWYGDPRQCEEREAIQESPLLAINGVDIGLWCRHGFATASTVTMKNCIGHDGTLVHDVEDNLSPLTSLSLQNFV